MNRRDHKADRLSHVRETVHFHSRHLARLEAHEMHPRIVEHHRSKVRRGNERLARHHARELERVCDYQESQA